MTKFEERQGRRKRRERQLGQRETWERQECERHVSVVLRHSRHRRDARERRDMRHYKRERKIQAWFTLVPSGILNKKILQSKQNIKLYQLVGD